MERSSGIILAISSLPGPGGIGSLGRAAYEFADFLEQAGQKYWQMLPLGPTGYGDSPYQSFSSYAGNPYFIDPEMLVSDGLLLKEELDACDWGGDPRYVDYGKLYPKRLELLQRAKDRGWEKDREAVAAFKCEQAGWLPDYALFMAVKRSRDMEPWTSWPRDIRLRESEACLEKYRVSLREDVELFTYIQFLFYRQWNALRDYVHEKGIQIIGDLPIYAAPDSADVWAEQHFFELDPDGFPLRVAGVPPDYFCEEGQLWGNPLYRWDRMEEDGFGWWIRRVDGASRLYDVLRIDHFRGLESYWAVPAEAESAREGSWQKGPGVKLVSVLSSWFPEIRYMAEDLGILTPEVGALLKASGWPGMKVLEFAFEPGAESAYLPHNIIPDCVCYTGTHDNAPLALWEEEAPPEVKAFARKYLALRPEEPLAPAVLRAGMASCAKLFMAPMQDWLGLGRGHVMNRPGEAQGNWRWRLLPAEASPELAQRIRELTELYGRYKSDLSSEEKTEE